MAPWLRSSFVMLLLLQGQLPLPAMAAADVHDNEQGKCRVDYMAMPGLPGNAGIPGNPGNLGLAGPPGKDGREGHQGLPGKNGEKGDMGEQGLKGDKGSVGETGLAGKFGPMGPAGLKGDCGPQGEKGHKGDAPPDIPISAFTVGLTVPNPPSGSPIRFSKVMYNVQNHYDTLPGKFICRFPGVYYFAYHLAGGSGPTQVSLRHNGQAVQNTYSSTTSIYSMSGGSVLRLRKGDEVWLQTEGANIKAYTDVTTDSTFSGFLMYPDLPEQLH
ncbi:complement C1q and tumor necrosis factor-related protein 9-like [Lethenteron reissneri]|uniref:complement C1q and tumor necrosis factor-related protein 9-like n=1 Tax=Lethenteron reissneri TaxID=7753 RepID=UPI002AB7BBCE|nr:complement C1q and tumor necrosis factor-related protein 9-like [Lethenteron reissneri]